MADFCLSLDLNKLNYDHCLQKTRLILCLFFFLSKCALISEWLDICAGKQDQNIIKSKWSHDLSTFQHFSCFDQRMIKERDFYYFTFHLLHWIIQKIF